MWEHPGVLFKQSICSLGLTNLELPGIYEHCPLYEKRRGQPSCRRHAGYCHLWCPCHWAGHSRLYPHHGCRVTHFLSWL